MEAEKNVAVAITSCRAFTLAAESSAFTEITFGLGETVAEIKLASIKATVRTSERLLTFEATGSTWNEHRLHQNLFQKGMLINTERLKLTNFKMDHAEAFAKALNDPKIFLYLPESVPDLNDIENLIRWFIERDRINVKKGFVGTNLAIAIKKTKELIGWCGLQPFDPIPDKKEIFYGLSPAYWDKGYMTEAAGAILKYGFEILNLDEIVAGVKPENVASIAVLEKIGLVFQNTIKKVPKGCEFYLEEYYYSIKKEQYLINKVLGLPA